MILTYNEFIDADMCLALIEKSKTISASLKTYIAAHAKTRQEYLDTQRESGHFVDERRGNRTQIFYDREDPLILPIRKKVAELTGLPIQNQTRPLVTIYNEGDQYHNHFDYIPDPGQGGQRLKSLVLYLNDDYEGGITYFMHHRLFVEPKIGKLLIFDNVKQEFYKFVGDEKFYRNGRDESVYHEALPVRKNSKFVLVLWIREDVPPI